MCTRPLWLIWREGVGDGKGSEALDEFWKRVKKKGITIKHVTTDLSAAFIASVYENCPGAVHVFDHFHVVKLMKEKSDEIRKTQTNKSEAEKVMHDWMAQAKESKVPRLMKMANSILAHRTGILAWYDYHISTGKVEGINNKIKVLKRTAYGFRDERYFKLRLYALHDCCITHNVG